MAQPGKYMQSTDVGLIASPNGFGTKASVSVIFPTNMFPPFIFNTLPADIRFVKPASSRGEIIFFFLYV